MTTTQPARKLIRKETLQESPSRKDGISQREERFLRQVYVRLLFSSGLLLQLPILATCRAAEYFQTFFANQSFAKHDPLHCVMASLLLASKISEVSRRVCDVFSTVYHLCQSSSATEILLPPNSTYWVHKDKIIRFEHKLLRVLNFSAVSLLPHNFVFHFCRELEVSSAVSSTAFYVINDSYCTTLCLQHRPETIACAAIVFAIELLKDSDGQRVSEPWIRVGCTKAEVEDVCAQLLELFAVDEKRSLMPRIALDTQRAMAGGAAAAAGGMPYASVPLSAFSTTTTTTSSGSASFSFAFPGSMSTSTSDLSADSGGAVGGDGDEASRVKVSLGPEALQLPSVFTPHLAASVSTSSSAVSSVLSASAALVNSSTSGGGSSATSQHVSPALRPLVPAQHQNAALHQNASDVTGNPHSNISSGNASISKNTT